MASPLCCVFAASMVPVIATNSRLSREVIRSLRTAVKVQSRRASLGSAVFYSTKTSCRVLSSVGISASQRSCFSSAVIKSQQMLFAQSADKHSLNVLAAVPRSNDKTGSRYNSQQAAEAGSSWAPQIYVKYENGLAVLSVPLPSRKENCLFTLHPITTTLGDFIDQLQSEDKGADRVTIYSLGGDRIAQATTIDVLLRKDFHLVINDQKFLAKVPHLAVIEADVDKDVSDVKNAIVKLYRALNVEQFQILQERQLLERLEKLRTQIEPMEKVKKELEEKAVRRTKILTWTGLGLMSIQFGLLARLTWFEYSWDIMEPVTYFVGYGTLIATFAYYVLTKQEYTFPEVRDREFRLTMHRQASKHNLDIARYNQLRDAIAQAEYDVKRLRDPLQLNLPMHHIPQLPSPDADPFKSG